VSAKSDSSVLIRKYLASVCQFILRRVISSGNVGQDALQTGQGQRPLSGAEQRGRLFIFLEQGRLIADDTVDVLAGDCGVIVAIAHVAGSVRDLTEHGALGRSLETAGVVGVHC